MIPKLSDKFNFRVRNKIHILILLDILYHKENKIVNLVKIKNNVKTYSDKKRIKRKFSKT